MDSDQAKIPTATRIVRRLAGAAPVRVSADICVLGAGIADDILRELGEQGALHYRRGGPSNTTVVMYDEIALSRWVEEAVRKAGITVLLGAVLRGVARDGARI